MSMSRSKRFGIGKEIGGKVYLHASYAYLLPTRAYQSAKRKLDKEHKCYLFDVVSFDLDSHAVTFLRVPRFDIDNDPEIESYVYVPRQGQIKKASYTNSPPIYHHKWLMVSDDYAGFDVEKSKTRSKRHFQKLKRERSSMNRTRNRQANPTSQIERDSERVFSFLSDALYKMKDAPFWPYLDTLLPESKPGVLQLIQKALEKKRAEKAEMQGAAMAAQLAENAKAANDSTFSFGGKSFTIEASLEPGNLVFYHALGEDKPILIESAKKMGGQVYSLMGLSQGRGPMERYRVEGFELGENGWKRLDVPIEDEARFDSRLLGNNLGFQSFEQVAPGGDPVAWLASQQSLIQRENAYERAEQEEADRRQSLRVQTKGLFFESEISKVIAKHGTIADTVEAGALRAWFKRNGVKVSIKVRRYSMASGLDFELLDKSEEAQAKLQEMTDIRPSEMGILAHNRTGQADILIKYPYVDELAMELAKRFDAFLEKNPDSRYYEMTVQGHEIAEGASISAMFDAKHPGVTTKATKPATEQVKASAKEKKAISFTDSSDATVEGELVATGEGFSIMRHLYSAKGPTKKNPKRKWRRYPAFAVRFSERFENDEFKDAVKKADERKGWFRRARFGQDSAFWFKSEENAVSFAEEMTGRPVIESEPLTPEQEEERREKAEAEAEIKRVERQLREQERADEKREDFADKWEDKAHSKGSQASNKLNPAIGQLRPTYRRMSIASSMYQDGRRLARIQCIAERLAERARLGTLPKILYKVTAFTHIETLDVGVDGDFPHPRLQRMEMGRVLEATADYRPKSEWVKIRNILEKRKGENGEGEPSSLDSWTVPISLEEAHIANRIVNFRAKQVSGKCYACEWAKNYFEDALRADRMGFGTEEKWREAVNALAMVIAECDPSEQQRLLRQREERINEINLELISRKIRGFHPTPEPIVDAMIDLAHIEPGDRVLEPSAGRGDIADRVRERIEGVQIDVAEAEPLLREMLTIKGYEVVSHDALSVHGLYDVILMNPPFHNKLDSHHVRHAYENNLKPGGRLVAIMGEGTFFRQHKQDEAFREFLREVQAQGGQSNSSKLQEGAFKSSFVSTPVSSRIVFLQKPSLYKYTSQDIAQSSDSVLSGKFLSNLPSKIARRFAADLANRAYSIFAEKEGRELAPVQKALQLAFQDSAMDMHPSELVQGTKDLQSLNLEGKEEKALVSMAIESLKPSAQRAAHSLVDLSGSFVDNAQGSKGKDQVWQGERLRFLMEVWETSGLRGMELLLEGNHPFGSGPLASGHLPSKTETREPNPTKQETERANDSARVNHRAIVPQYVGIVAGETDKILDFGAEKNPIHTRQLIEEGFDVDAYDFGENATSEHIQKLKRDHYDVVFASNVLNVQGSKKMLIETLNQIRRTLKRDGVFLANYPNDPRYNDLDVERVLALVKKMIGPFRILEGGKSKPVFFAIKA